MGCGNSTLQHEHSVAKRYEAGTIRITAMASGLAPATPYFSPYTRNRVKQASAYAQRMQEVFTIYTPVAFNPALLGQDTDSADSPAVGGVRHSKIFCTLGPASATEAAVQELVFAGMDVGVLDLSTGNHKEHQIVLDRIRRVEADQARTVAVCMNTKRPNILTGRLTGHQPLNLTAGQTLSIRGSSSDMDGGLDPKTGRITVFVTTDALCQIVKEGSSILIADDSIMLKVTSISSDRQCEVNVVKAAKPLGEHYQVQPAHPIRQQHMHLVQTPSSCRRALQEDECASWLASSAISSSCLFVADTFAVAGDWHVHAELRQCPFMCDTLCNPYKSFLHATPGMQRTNRPVYTHHEQLYSHVKMNISKHSLSCRSSSLAVPSPPLPWLSPPSTTSRTLPALTAWTLSRQPTSRLLKMLSTSGASWWSVTMGTASGS